MNATNNSLKYAKIEEERRFLLKMVPADLDTLATYLKIIDRYITGTRLRLRRMEAPDGEIVAYKLGQKYQAVDGAASETVMTNFYLNTNEYTALTVLKGNTIIKRRYAYPHGGYDYSLDVFEGHLDGLLLLEIERRPGVEIDSLPVPAFAIREVTHDPFFTGGELAALTTGAFKQWAAWW